VPIRYTNAVYDEACRRWISDVEVAEIPFIAFTSKAKSKQVSARLIVRRVPDVNPDNQDPLFVVYRYHTVPTNSPLPMLEAEKAHRGHAVVEQVIATIAFNLTRAAGVLASPFHAKATTGTLRAQLINVPARPAHSARRLVLHLPVDWPWETAWTQLAESVRHGPPLAA